MVAFIVKIRSLNKYQCGLELKNWKILTIVNQTTTETTIHPEKLEWWNHQTPSFVLIFLFFFYKIASLNNSLTDKLKAYCITTIHSALQTLVENICFPFQHATVQSSDRPKQCFIVLLEQNRTSQLKFCFPNRNRTEPNM